MVEIKLIESCLAGYTFILGSSEKYKFGEKLHPLLELTGVKYLHIDKFYANSQMDAILKYEIDRTGAGDNDQQILLVPAKCPLEYSKICVLFPLSKITDVKLFAAILSGRLEATAIEPPAYIVASSNSTDETIVADSDVEVDTATSDHTVAASKSQHHIEHSSDDKMEDTVRTTEDAVNLGETKANINIYNDLEKDDVSKPMEDDVKVIEKAAMYGFKARGEDVRVINKVPKDDDVETSRNEACDVIFSQDLVVKSILQSAPAMSIETGGINFKRFRNMETVSGNSFKDLVPFAREPYRESDYERGTLTDFMREKRKQMEAIAEDIFNNSKPKKKAAAGSSIHTLLTGRR